LDGPELAGIERSSLVVLALVLIVSVVVCVELDEVKLRVDGESEQEPGEGIPEQVSVTGPVYPPTEEIPTGMAILLPDIVEVGGITGAMMPLTLIASVPVAETAVPDAR